MTGEAGYRPPVACEVAGISYRQLDYWARTGLVFPSVRPAAGSGSQRLYSARDVVLLAVTRRLLDAGVALQSLRPLVIFAETLASVDLADVTLLSDGRGVYPCRTGTEIVEVVDSGECVFGLTLGPVVRAVEEALASQPGLVESLTDAGSS